jgi:ribose 5-phosphate isomerase B
LTDSPNTPLRIAFSADHAGYALKTVLIQWLREQGHDVLDLGTDSDASVDYPDFGYRLANALERGDAPLGITICGSGIGIAIAANRSPAVRCAQVAEPVSAALARRHNDANAIALGARLIGVDMAKACVTAFLETPFEGGRHTHRVDKLAHPQIEEAR